MKPAIVVFAALAPLVLTACGIPDLVAHGVKSYEGTQDKARQYDAGEPAPRPQPAVYTPARAPEPAPVAVEAAPPRETVVAEPLQ